MISVLISVYAKETPAYFDEALTSVVNQLTGDDELVLIKDGKVSDEIDNIIKKYESCYPIKVVQIENNVGLANALNIGVCYASQPWILRFDSDDICAPDRIAQQKEFILSANYDFFGGQIIEFDEITRKHIGQRRVPSSRADIISMLYKRNPFNHVTVCIKRHILIKNPYPNIQGFEDYALWAKLLSKDYNCANINSVLVYVRAGRSMLERRSGLSYILKEIRLRLYIIELGKFSTFQLLKYGFLRSLLFAMPAGLKSFFYKYALRE